MNTSRTSNKNPRTNLNKIRVYLTETCYICGNGYSSAYYTITHVEKVHGFNIPRRARSQHRIQDPKFEYVKDSNDKYAIEEIACPCCWKHFPKDDLKALHDHTIEEHDPVNTGVGNDDEGYTSAGGPSRAPVRRRKGDVQPATGEKVITVPEAAMNEFGRKLEDLTDYFRNLMTRR